VSIWLSEADVVSLIDMGEAIQAVEQGLRAEQTGQAANLPKTHLQCAKGSMHSLGASVLSDDVLGVKSWAHTPGGANPLLILWRASDGALLAVIEAFALGQYRTGAIGGAAVHALARDDATHLAILGSGRQALAQVGGVAAVRHLSGVTVWSPAEAHRNALADKVRETFGTKAVAASSVEEACDGADIVTLVTRATSPFLRADTLAPGTHINAMGAIAPDRAEFDPELLQRCSLVTTDNVADARALSRELGEFYGDDDTRWASVEPICARAGEQTVRPADADLTLFKSMGAGIADVSIGWFIYQRALENRLGTALEQPTRSRPRMRSNLARTGIGYV
jgi:ornithine cyclodeaminase